MTIVSDHNDIRLTHNHLYLLNIPTFDAVEGRTYLLAASLLVDDFREVVFLPSPRWRPPVVSLVVVFVVEIADPKGQFFLCVNHSNAEVGFHEYRSIWQGIVFPTFKIEMQIYLN